MIITGLRIKALVTVDFQDWSYSKGCLGLLSALGSYVSVILSAGFTFPRLFSTLRERRREYKEARREYKARRQETIEKVRSLGLRFSKEAMENPGFSPILKEEVFDQEEEISLDEVVMWSSLEAF